MTDGQETKLSPETCLEGGSMADFRCRRCGINQNVGHSGGTSAMQGLVQCSSSACRSWTPFKVDNGILVTGENLMPARVCPNCKVKAAFRRLWDWPPIDATDVAVVDALDMCSSCGYVAYFKTDRLGQKVTDQYPKNVPQAPQEIPEKIRIAFQEALLCYGAGGPNGSLLMCRRALQEVMNDKQAKKGDLPVQLNDLVARGVIIPRLKDWADQARIGGRIAAHGGGGDEWGDPDKIWGTMEDAQIVIEYLNGFFEFVYVLDARMNARFGEHGASPASQSGTDSNAP